MNTQRISRHVPITKQNPAIHIPVKDVAEAKKKIQELTEADLKNPKITDNVGGLQVFQDGEWCEYYDGEGRDIDQIIEEEE